VFFSFSTVAYFKPTIKVITRNSALIEEKIGCHWNTATSLLHVHGHYCNPKLIPINTNTLPLSIRDYKMNSIWHIHLIGKSSKYTSQIEALTKHQCSEGQCLPRKSCSLSPA